MCSSAYLTQNLPHPIITWYYFFEFCGCLRGWWLRYWVLVFELCQWLIYVLVFSLWKTLLPRKLHQAKTYLKSMKHELDTNGVNWQQLVVCKVWKLTNFLFEVEFEWSKNKNLFACWQWGRHNCNVVEEHPKFSQNIERKKNCWQRPLFMDLGSTTTRPKDCNTFEPNYDIYGQRFVFCSYRNACSIEGHTHQCDFVNTSQVTPKIICSLFLFFTQTGNSTAQNQRCWFYTRLHRWECLPHP